MKEYVAIAGHINIKVYPDQKPPTVFSSIIEIV